MANPEHLEILNQGVEVWNEWRESEDGKAIIPDLRNANLRGINLTGANLREVNFQRAVLDKTKFIGANLAEANLRESSLKYANFRYAHLIKTDFYRANIYKANFTSVYFFEANFAKALGIETVGLELNISNGYTLEEINTSTDGSYFISTIELSRKNQIKLVFSNGIDWLAFLAAYKEINKEVIVKIGENERIKILEITNYHGLLVVKVKLPPGVNKIEIERSFIIKYENIVKDLHESYKNRLNVKDVEIEGFRRENTNLTKLLENLANNQSINNVNIGGNVGSFAMGENNRAAGRDIKNNSDIQNLFTFIVCIFALALLLGVF